MKSSSNIIYLLHKYHFRYQLQKNCIEECSSQLFLYSGLMTSKKLSWFPNSAQYVLLTFVLGFKVERNQLGRRFDLPPKPCVRIWDNFFQNARTCFCSLRLYNCNKFGIKTVVDLFSIRQGLAQSLIMSRVLQTSLCPDNPEKSLDKDIVNLVNIKMIVTSRKIYEYPKMSPAVVVRAVVAFLPIVVLTTHTPHNTDLLRK